MRLERPGFSGLVIAHSRHDLALDGERIGDSEKGASGFSNDKSASDQSRGQGMIYLCEGRVAVAVGRSQLPIMEVRVAFERGVLT